MDLKELLTKNNNIYYLPISSNHKCCYIKVIVIEDKKPVDITRFLTSYMPENMFKRIHFETTLKVKDITYISLRALTRLISDRLFNMPDLLNFTLL